MITYGNVWSILDFWHDPGNVSIDFDENWIKLNGNEFGNVPGVSKEPVREGDIFDLGAQKPMCCSYWRIQK